MKVKGDKLKSFEKFILMALNDEGPLSSVELDDKFLIFISSVWYHRKDKGTESLIEEIVDDSKPTGRGRGANKSDLDKGDTSKVNVLTIDEVRKALTDLDITYADDETVEQLQAKLTQATE